MILQEFGVHLPEIILPGLLFIDPSSHPAQFLENSRKTLAHFTQTSNGGFQGVKRVAG